MLGEGEDDRVEETAQGLLAGQDEVMPLTATECFRSVPTYKISIPIDFLSLALAFAHLNIRYLSITSGWDKMPSIRGLSLFLALCCLSFALAISDSKTTRNKFVLHERRSAPPHGWTKRSRAHPTAPLQVRIGLTQSNLHLASEYMLDVSDPTSPNFGEAHYLDTT